MNGSKHQEHIIYFDILNIMATISVVWIHFGNEVHWYDGSQVWYWCLFIQVICYWAVPVFFMLTGATCLNYRERYSTIEFLKRRFKRTLIPYLFWGGVLIGVRSVSGTLQFPHNASLQYKTYWILDCYMNNRMEAIYWFLIVLFGIYLSIPILSLIMNCISKYDLRYFVITAIVTISILPFVNSFLIEVFGFEGSAWNTALELPILGSYLIFPLLGYWLSVTDFDKKKRILIYLLAAVMAIFRYEGLKLLSERDGMTNQLFMNYKAIPSVLFAIGVFVFFKYNNGIFKFGNKFKNIIPKISSCSFGVYLIHNIILSIMSRVSFFEKYSFQWYFVWPFICYFFCVSLVWLCKKNRLLKWIFP